MYQVFLFQVVERLGAGKTPIQINEVFYVLRMELKDLVLRYMYFYINCLHLPLLIGYSLWSIHRPIFRGFFFLRKMNTVFILKDCHKK